MTLGFIERLPVLRNQLATAQFAPGVNGNTLSNGQLYISGGTGYDNLVLVNGVVVTENTRGQMRPMYVEDAIQETTVLTGAISAGTDVSAAVWSAPSPSRAAINWPVRIGLVEQSLVVAQSPAAGNPREQSQSRS